MIIGTNISRKASLVSLLILVAVGSVSISGCEKDPGVAIWASRVKSPDGIWIAEATTNQWAGPGNNYVDTAVALKWTPDSRRPPIDVLELSNESAYPIGVTRVKMQWVTNSHLDVVYGTGVKVEFQAIKAAGVEITAHR